MEQSLYNRQMRWLKWVEKLRYNITITPLPLRHSNPWCGRNSKPGASPWRVKGLYPTPGNPMFKSSTWDETQNIWLWKQAGFTLTRHMGLWWVLKGFTCRPTELSAETLWKQKKNYLLILKHWSEGQELLGYSLGIEAGGCHLPILPLPS